MGHFISACIVLTLLIVMAAFLVIWTRRQTRIRAIAVLLAILALPISASALVTALGWAVPMIPVLTAPGGKYHVLGSKMVVNEAIYVLIDVGPGEPRYYRLDWNKDEANKLQDMLDDPKSGGVMVDIPFEFSWDRHPPKFSPLPQPKVLPDKPPQQAVPHFDA